MATGEWRGSCDVIHGCCSTLSLHSCTPLVICPACSRDVLSLPALQLYPSDTLRLSLPLSLSLCSFLDREEFAVCWYLITWAKTGKPLPDELPTAVVPPSKMDQWRKRKEARAGGV